MNKKTIAAILACAAMHSATAFGAETSDMDQFIDSLLSKMTLEEKLGQMNLPPSDDIVTGAPMNSNIGQAVAEGRVGGTFNVKGAEKVKALQQIAVEQSRLGIPLIIGMDVIHGYETIFPIPLAMAATWDMEAVERSARVAATEASAAGINWTFSPMVDISRDPRWGRMAEGAGEDPYLGGEVARAMVRGYQGDLKSDTQIMACIKHFALYGASEAGRDYNTVDMSRLRMFNEYLAPYRAAVDEGAGSIMTSFNLVDGIPATANKWLVTDVLRHAWKFGGFVVTDYNSIGEISIHGLGEQVHASAMALNAGTDMDMAAGAFIAHLSEALERGEVTEAQIDEAVRRILEAKYRLGLFENPYKYNDTSREKTDIYTRANRDQARAAAVKSFVLLKNDDRLLPLKPQGSIALIGPLANTAANLTGTWCVAADHSKYKTLLQGLRDAADGKAEILYAKGSNIYADPRTERGVAFGRDIRDSRSDDELLAEALEVAAKADVIIAAVGEMSESSGESASRTDLELPATQKRLLEALAATGKPVVMLNFSGRPTVMTWESERIPAILNVWFGGSEAADAIADVLFGAANPSGKLPVSMPRNVGQIPLYYNHLSTGRPPHQPWTGFQQYVSNYVDAPNTPLYPFGFGLSYTDFRYSDFAISSSEMTMDGKITASVTVTNTGDRQGDEIVQFYTRDLVGSISRPVQELKHFERISLNPGESRTVSFDITADCLRFYNSDLDYVAEPGEFLIMAGPSSDKVDTLRFTLK